MCNTSVLYVKSLYGLDNFYYRRFLQLVHDKVFVYTDLIISTIVDNRIKVRSSRESIRT